MEAGFDYIIVGAGSSGCVAAARLVQDHGARVLLVEAGPKDNSPLIHMPAGSFKILFGKSPFVKRYASVPQAALDGRSVSIPQGNVVGGGSSVNVMAYTRGTKADYDDWDAALGGDSGWDWESLLPYFRRQEGNIRLDNGAHGGDGPLKVSDPRYIVPAAHLFLRSLQRLGMPFRDDFNAGELYGAGFIQTTIDGKVRCSAADAFLRPIGDDPRLTIITGAAVQRVIIENGRATGVALIENGQARTVHASQEVVLAAGTFATPKLLMLSGIGAAGQLRSHGIDVACDLPGVGLNLQDHNVTFLTAPTRGSYGYFGEDKGFRMIRNILRYGLFGDGPIASNGAETMAFINLADRAAPPDIQLYCLGVMWPALAASEQRAGITLMANLVRPKSRGSVRLRSADPNDDPLVDLGWLSHPDDGARMVRALRYLREIAATHPLAEILEEERLPGASASTDEELLAFIRSTTESNYHPVGTCKMGADTDPDAVLDATLRVRGVDKLRVIDASMMPTIISANTNATVMAVADRAIDMMMGG
ncbi:MAG: glucose-methanol-choline oxidoreductase [Bradyrhizobium sp.]|nr:glucose-methanol-choline oxidoreductase [Bradyrhizobium sp.]